jgi:hypothetical protein
MSAAYEAIRAIQEAQDQYWTAFHRSPTQDGYLLDRLTEMEEQNELTVSAEEAFDAFLNANVKPVRDGLDEWAYYAFCDVVTQEASSLGLIYEDEQ